MKIISGGQTGADQAGLYAAETMGYETGGHAPKTFRTLGGPVPELGTRFGLVEHFKFEYPPRTEENVRNSDCTFRLAHNFNSPGEKCTLKFIKKHNKPKMDIDINNPVNPFIVAKWLKENGYTVINIAGNGDGKANGEHFKRCYIYLINVFEEYEKL